MDIETEKFFLAEFEHVMSHPLGAAGRMMDMERARGHRLVFVGDNIPFSLPLSHWHGNAVIALDGIEVRIVAIWAKHQGQGAFTRLIDNIKAAGLTPVVLTPIGDAMPAILKKWGWVRTDVGEGFKHEEQWRAP